ncbi:MAG: ketopantoate reductase family protein [Clostridiales bacterium]|jgi:2-dehydropantoate 2-reductase|nr:ketopantoate reductase family protein [Clostridiales bacterium]
MKILFFGRGAIGTQYAWALEKAGHTVEFYVREGRKAQYGSHVNLEILDARRGKKDRLVKEKWPIVIHEDIPSNHNYDLIFVSVNPEQITSSVEYLAPRIGNASVLFIGNFWRDIKQAAHPIPLNQVVWGFPGCGGGCEGNTIYGGLYKTINFGLFESEPSARDIEIHKLFADAGFKVALHRDFQSWLMNHFVSNAAMEMEVLKSGSFEKVSMSKEALAGVNSNTKEMIPILKAKGVRLDTLTKAMGVLPPRAVGSLMKNLVFSPNSMPFALMKHNHYKVGAAVQEIISEARKYNIQAPRLFEAERLITQK